VLLKRFHKEPRRVTELSAVIDSLNRILSTKKSFGFWVEGYGIGDFNKYRSRERIVATLVEEIKENVRRFEPRIRVDSVAEVPTEGAFKIKLQMSVMLDTPRPLRVTFDALGNSVVVEG
jgi:predicted component of type VI protein secretion system